MKITLEMNPKKYLLALLVTGFLSGCQSDDDNSQGNHGAELKEQVISNDRDARLISDEQLDDVIRAHLLRLYGRFSQQNPGYGKTDYPGNYEEHIPKSYAKILLAELEREGFAELSKQPDLGINSGIWLLENVDLNGNGIKGWGVPLAWDAYGDGSENPAHTEYTITTAIVIQALIDWYLSPVSAPKDQIMGLIKEAVEPYLNDSILSPSGLFPYSLREPDRPYNTFNPAAYLAGQFQRLSSLVDDSELASKLASAADLTILALYNNHLINEKTGSWYWYYSIEEHVPNDLPHASYIIDGINTYIEFSGKHSSKFDLEKVRGHLYDFVDGDRVQAWPVFRIDVDMSARSYDLGMALHLTCSYPELKELSKTYVRAVDRYLTDEGLYLKYPVPEGGVKNFSVNEYEAYLYRGLMSCVDQENEILELPLTDDYELAIGSQPAQPNLRVPFTLEQEKNANQVYVYFNITERTFVLNDDSGKLFQTLEAGIPLAFYKSANALIAVTRSLETAELAIQVFENGAIERVLIPTLTDSNLIYRASEKYLDQLYLVLFDNQLSKNFLYRFSIDQDNFLGLIGEPKALPSLNDPAGSTYEMIPSIYFSKSESGIALLGGNLVANLHQDGSFSDAEIFACSRIIEVIDTKEGPATLCLSIGKNDSKTDYFITAPEGYSWKPIDQDATPWGLSLKGNEIAYQSAKTASEYAQLLSFDMGRSQQGGWMEFGIENTEGRVPWSQIYYLNGYLDLLYIAKRNPRFNQAFTKEIKKFRKRLDLEMALIDTLWEKNGYHTRAFTVDRSPALFAVQTGRLLLLMERYKQEVADGVKLGSYEAIKRAVESLENHIDVLAFDGEPESWIEKGMPHLRWPKGSGFYFDGVAVPYNHQNEWAYSVLFTQAKDGQCSSKQCGHAKKIIEYFLDNQSVEGELPRNGIWDYWWGTARDGWKKEDAISVNLPEFTGDYLKAWISFRSIDTMSALQAKRFENDSVKFKLESSALGLLKHGYVYPFVAYELSRSGVALSMRRDIALRYSRVSAPWELQSSVWALAFLSQSKDGNLQ